MNENKRKMRFLFLSSDLFPPFRVDVKVLFFEKMAARGHMIDWILQSENPCDAGYHTFWNNCRVWVGPTDVGNSRTSRLKKHIRGIKNDLKVFELSRKNKYDFIQVKDKFISALMALIASRLTKTKFIYWLSYPFPEESLYKFFDGKARYPLFYLFRGLFFKFLLYEIIMKFADHVFVQSDQMKLDVMKMGIPCNKITPVPMAVVLDTIPYNKNDLTKVYNSGVKKIVYLGTLIKIRRLDFLIKVFSIVLKNVPNSKMILVGSGDDETDEAILKQEARELDIAHAIEFTGFMPMEKAWEIVREADVCVSPFYPTPILNSTSPTKLIEYMAMGKAVVANDHPEQRIVIEESGGGVCVPYDVQDFAEAIIKLLKNPEITKNMGIKGREYVERKRDYNHISEMVEYEYFKILGVNVE
jgi:glycosyltransferase involved in cell wall biosynthesis